MNWNNKITRLLNLKYPIVQAPMFGVSTTEMVAATAKAGCLGSLALADLDAEKCAHLIRKTKQFTPRDFAVNIFVHQIPEVNIVLKKQYQQAKIFVDKLAAENNLIINSPEFDELKIQSYHEQIDVIIAERCKILSFTFGNLDDVSIEKLKRNGTILIGTCTSVEEAKILENSGIDIVCVQGWEAGGHRGSFVTDNIPKIGGMVLLSQVSEVVKCPIIYAGGIYNAKTLRAAKVLGASGFQVGSLLLGSAESALQEFEKKRLRKTKENEIVLTKTFSGRFARGIENEFMRKMQNSGLTLPYPYQNKLTSAMRKAAKNAKNFEFVNLWLGQSNSKLSENSTTEILENLIHSIG